jgi:NAD(P)-dependent dehydrogenase (short-subunit alcohol dehydrogenase family)
VISAGKQRRCTAQGLELTVATNHFGHFALTAQSMPILTATRFKLDLDDLQSERTYHPRNAYVRSKHATQIFGFELDRRLRDSDLDVRAIVADPGGGLDAASPRRQGINEPSALVRAGYRVAFAFVQGKDRCA